MIAVIRPISTEITLNITGSVEHIHKLKDELMRLSMTGSFVLNGSYKGELSAEIKLLVCLKDVKKAIKIIDKHTQYFTDIKKFKNKVKTDKLKKD